MENRLNLIITTATAAMLLMPMKTDAQKIASGLISPVSQPKVEQLVKTSPATKKKMEMETRQKYPKLYEGKLLQKKNDYRGLQRFGGRKAMSPLSIEPRVPFRAAVPTGRELWGSVAFDDTWEEDNELYGFYKFYAGNQMNVEALGLNRKLTPNGGGAIVGDRLYFVNYVSLWGSIYPYFYVINTDTWELEGEGQYLSNTALIATETATTENGTVYGVFLSADATKYELGIVDYENMTRSTIGTVENRYVALGITKDNVLYGVASDGNLYKINSITAEETLIGATGLNLRDTDGSTYYQSGEIDQATGTFYWAAVDSDGDPKLYTVNLTTGAAELMGSFTNNNVIMLLTVPEALAPGAPAMATDLTTNFANGSLDGEVTFKLPTTSVSGEKLYGYINYTVSEGANTLMRGFGSPGATITEDVTLASDGQKKITVITSNSEGKGQTAKTFMYAGFDTPKKVENLKLNIEGCTANLTWNAVTEGDNGGYVGQVKYDVVRYPGAVNVAKGLTQPNFTDRLSGEDLTAYTYGVKAYNEKKSSEEVKSNTVLSGESVALPYFEGFDTEESMAYFTVIDDNDDGYTWGYYVDSDDNGYVRYKYSSINAGDDWLITPAIRVKKGNTYVVKFKAKSEVTYYVERLEVMYGKSNDVAGMTNELMPVTDLKGGDFTEFSNEILATEDGLIYIGFHAVSDVSKYSLNLDDISVSAGLLPTAPDAVSDLVVTAGDKGAMNATVDFTVPNKSINGSALTGKMNLKLMRDGEIIKEYNNVAVGSKQTFFDTGVKEGFNSYCLSTENANGNGRTSQPVKVYVGVDKPDYPDIEVTDQISSVNVSWVDKQRGANGGYVDRANLSHKFYTFDKGSSGYTPVLDAEIPAGQSSYVKTMNTNEGEQVLTRFGVSSVSNGEESEIGFSPAMVVGKPYELPFFESVPKGELSNGLWWILYDNFQLSEFNMSSDGDGGCIAMLSGSDTGHGMLGSGKICLAGANNPKLIFSHMAMASSEAKVNVAVQKPDGSIEDLKTVDVAADDGYWVRETIDLKPEYTTLPYIILRFTGTAKSGQALLLDEFYVRDVYENDLTMTEISAPEKMKKGEKAKVYATVTNFGSSNVKDYKVNFYVDDQLVNTMTKVEELAPYKSETYVFEYASSAMLKGNSVSLKAEVEYDDDLNPEDNVKSTTVSFVIPNKPRPENVTVKDNDGSVTVNWVAATETSEMVEEDFESYDSWSQDEFGDWRGMVGEDTPDDAVVGGLFLSYEYPGQGEQFAFVLADPLNNWITETMLENNPVLKPHSGNKYLAAFQKLNGEAIYDQFYDADNWLISPTLSGNKQTVTFWVSNSNLSYVNYIESFDVLYSTEGTDFEDFIKIGETRTATKGEWEQVTVEIPEGATHFAIHQITNSDSNFLFLIDDVKFEAGSGKVLGYNIYRDGTLLKSVGPDKVEFTDETTGHGKTYVYGVTAVYAEGESEATLASEITTDINSIEQDIAKASSYEVYTLDGKLIGKPMKSLKSLTSGAYVINGQKVVIK